MLNKLLFVLTNKNKKNVDKFFLNVVKMWYDVLKYFIFENSYVTFLENKKNYFSAFSSDTNWERQII